LAQDQYTPLPDGSVVCELRCRIGEEWIVKTDVGGASEQPDAGDRIKGDTCMSITLYLYGPDQPTAKDLATCLLEADGKCRDPVDCTSALNYIGERLGHLQDALERLDRRFAGFEAGVLIRLDRLEKPTT
jgi:hypothetical protein